MLPRSKSSLMSCGFPSLTDEHRQRLSGRCQVGELSGAVSAQLFLMRMGLSAEISSEETEIEDLEEELRRWGIATLTGLKNLDLFVMLLQVLTEQEPLTSTLESDVGVLLKKVLYGVILVDYAFLDLESEDHPSFSHLKSIALMRLIVAFQAVELFRQGGDQSKAILCEYAFSTSRLPTHLVKLVPNGDGLNKCTRNGSSPKAFSKWFQELEQQGVKVFPDGAAKYADKLSFELLEPARNRPVHDPAEGEEEEGTANDDDITFCIDKEADKDTENKEGLDEVSKAFVAAAHKMSTAETNKPRKRKAGSSGKGKKKKKEKKRSVRIEGDNKLNSGEESED